MAVEPHMRACPCTTGLWSRGVPYRQERLQGGAESDIKITERVQQATDGALIQVTCT